MRGSSHPAASDPGIVLREADSLEAVGRFLERNPGMSFIAIHESPESFLFKRFRCGHPAERPAQDFKNAV